MNKWIIKILPTVNRRILMIKVRQSVDTCLFVWMDAFLEEGKRASYNLEFCLTSRGGIDGTSRFIPENKSRMTRYSN